MACFGAKLTLAAVAVTLVSGCPSLGAIGVGGGDAGIDRAVDAPRDAPSLDAPHDAGPDAGTLDAASDPKNCGRCGHDCMGGECKDDRCQPYAIVTGNEGPYGVAVNSGNVYFTSLDNTVSMWAPDGGTVTQMTSGQNYPRRITTDTTNVYWANMGYGQSDGGESGAIATCGLSGCTGGIATTLAAPENGPVDLAVQSGTVYWSTFFSKLVQSCPNSAMGDMTTTLYTSTAILSGAAVDDSHVYWTEPLAGNVIQCPLGGCTSPTPFASGQNHPMEVDVVDTTLYWSNGGSDGVGGSIMTCSTAACVAPKVFADNQPSALALAHDDTNLYWTVGALGGSVVSCPLAGCTTPLVLGAMQKDPTSVAVDDTAVYWANYGGGTVMRVMK
jgi:hypothetical protein